jgi:hypothetical protein
MDDGSFADSLELSKSRRSMVLPSGMRLGPYQILAPIVLAILLLNAALTFAAAPVSRMVNVNSVSLEYLDWGGSGPPMVFLAGLGDPPYIYNELASELTSRSHCYGMREVDRARNSKR